MKKTSLKYTLMEMARLGRIMPKSITESMDAANYMDLEGNSMGEEAVMDMPQDDMQQEEVPQDENMPQQDGMPQGEQPMDGEGKPIPGSNPSNVNPEAVANAARLINNIRKDSLRAMGDLADNPEDENYLMLKKVWQMTDRKPEKEEEKK